MAYDQLKLENQICFPVYAATRLITRAYQPFLEELGLTYPQYLVLMVLWEADGLGVNEIAEKLLLQTNTITPLLKRMEKEGLLNRMRSRDDERKVLVSLTERGRHLEEKASLVPEELTTALGNTGMSREELMVLKSGLDKLVKLLRENEMRPARSYRNSTAES
jgi:DNA-binding MarR family transcriptional regulator